MPRRRYWGDADNLQIVEGSFVGRREVAVTTRRHGIALPADYVAAAVSEWRALRRVALPLNLRHGALSVEFCP